MLPLLLLLLQDPQELDELLKRVDALEARVRRLESEACSRNLAELYRMQHNYMVRFGGPMKLMPPDTGPMFWTRLSKTKPALVADDALLVCPASREKSRPGYSSYHGPRENANLTGDGDAVGACVGYHPDDAIVVVRKSGDVQVLRPRDAFYRRALEGTLGQRELLAACEHLVANLAMATKLYELDFGVYPESGGAGLVKALGSQGPKKLPYFEFKRDMLNAKGEVLDPWLSPVIYKRTDRGFKLYSRGPDGKDDGGKGDDVTNWE